MRYEHLSSKYSWYGWSCDCYNSEIAITNEWGNSFIPSVRLVPKFTLFCDFLFLLRCILLLTFGCSWAQNVGPYSRTMCPPHALPCLPWHRTESHVMKVSHIIYWLPELFFHGIDLIPGFHIPIRVHISFWVLILRYSYLKMKIECKNPKWKSRNIKLKT